MNPTTKLREGADHSLQLELVVIYDPHKVAARTLQVIQALVQRFSTDIELFGHLFSYDSLESPATSAVADDAGRHADLLVVAARCDSDLPQFVKQWLHKCISQRKPNSAGIAALLEYRPNEFGAKARTAEFLDALAKSRHLDFFLHELELAERAPALQAGS